VIVHFSLCAGGELALCRSCRRLAERHPLAAAAPNQPFVFPVTDGRRCTNWSPIPSRALNLPRLDTGD
jgi:hypothetical protein